jgi:hypothetical protein
VLLKYFSINFFKVIKMKKIFVYGVFLVLSNFIYAETVEIKIDFARVQDVKDNPSQTAACIIAWVGNNTEEKVFCRYELEKPTNFLRDNTEVDKILSKKMKLLSATSKNFSIKVKDWLANIGNKDRKLSDKISTLFANFLKQGVTDYKAYLGYEAGLFANAKPHYLVLPKKLDNSNEVFAILVHSEVHRAVSEQLNTSPNTMLFEEQMRNKYGSQIVNILNNQQKILRQVAITNLLDNPEIIPFINQFKTTNYDVLTLLSEYADVFKREDIKIQLDIIKNNKKFGDENQINPMVWILFAVLLLLLLAVILWQLIKSQHNIDNIHDFFAETSAKPQDKIANQELITQISKLIRDDKTSIAIAAQVTSMISGIKFQLNEASKLDLVKRIKVAISQEDIDNIVVSISKQAIKNKHEILDAISVEKVKVEQEQKKLELSHATVQNELAQTQQNMQETEIELSETKTQLNEVQNQHQSMKKSLEILMTKRFGIAKPELLPEISEQEGTWQWLQTVLTAQYDNYHQAFSNVKNLHDTECEKILELLNIQNILKHWHDFLNDNPHLESNERLMGLLEAKDGGMWLSNVLRADELFKMYFADKTQLESLSTPLAITAILLQAALKELGVEVIKPNLLESPPVNLAPNARKMTTNPLLMELLHETVMTKLSDEIPQLIVDVERYGFITVEGISKTTMKVLVADLGGWEQY